MKKQRSITLVVIILSFIFNSAPSLLEDHNGSYYYVSLDENSSQYDNMEDYPYDYPLVNSNAISLDNYRPVCDFNIEVAKGEQIHVFDTHLLDISGRFVQAFNGKNVDVSDETKFRKGVYIVHVNTDKGYTARKITKL